MNKEEMVMAIESDPLKEYIKDLQSQLDKSNNKIEKIKEYVVNIKSTSENSHLDAMCIKQKLLSIIDEENK